MGPGDDTPWQNGGAWTKLRSQDRSSRWCFRLLAKSACGNRAQCWSVLRDTGDGSYTTWAPLCALSSPRFIKLCSSILFHSDNDITGKQIPWKWTALLMKQCTHVAERGPNITLLFKKRQKPILLQASSVLEELMIFYNVIKENPTKQTKKETHNLITKVKIKYHRQTYWRILSNIPLKQKMLLFRKKDVVHREEAI